MKLQDALSTSIDDLDGTFSFLVSTDDEIGYAKDRLAAKPMIMYEDDDLVARLQRDLRLAVAALLAHLQPAHPDLGALGVEHDGAHAPRVHHRLVQVVERLLVILVLCGVVCCVFGS